MTDYIPCPVCADDPDRECPTCDGLGAVLGPLLDFKLNEYVRDRCQYRSHPNDVAEPESCGHPMPCPMHSEES